MQKQNPEYYEDEIREGCEATSRMIIKANKTQGREKQNLFDEIEEEIKKAQKNWRGLNRAILREGISPEWKRKAVELKAEIQKLTQNYETAKDKSLKEKIIPEEPKKNTKQKKRKDEEDEVVIVEASSSEKVNDKKSGKITHDQVVDDLFKDIYGLHNDSLQIVQGLIVKAEDTKAIAADSLEMLKRQREQLERIDKDLDELGDTIKRGKAEVVSFMRRLATEKLVLVLIVLVILAIAGVIIWRIVDYVIKQVNKGNNNTPTKQ
ncbi:hypothetical protein ABK040_002816 [Willaertia magna]